MWASKRDVPVRVPSSTSHALVIHGDDSTPLENADDLDWYETCLGKFFELKVKGRMGDNTDSKELRLLNRIDFSRPQV